MESSVEEYLRGVVEEGLAIADRYGMLNVGIALNSALVELDGKGCAPVDIDADTTH